MKWNILRLSHIIKCYTGSYVACDAFCVNSLSLKFNGAQVRIDKLALAICSFSSLQMKSIQFNSPFDLVFERWNDNRKILKRITPVNKHAESSLKFSIIRWIMSALQDMIGNSGVTAENNAYYKRSNYASVWTFYLIKIFKIFFSLKKFKLTKYSTPWKLQLHLSCLHLCKFLITIRGLVCSIKSKRWFIYPSSKDEWFSPTCNHNTIKIPIKGFTTQADFSKKYFQQFVTFPSGYFLILGIPAFSIPITRNLLT